MSGPEPLSAAGLRHALRTPLNHIIGYGEMLLEDIESPSLGTLVFEAREAVKAVQNGFSGASDTISAQDLQLLRQTLLPRVERMRLAVSGIFEALPEKPGDDLLKIRTAIRTAVERLSRFAADEPGALAALSAGATNEIQQDSQGTGGRLLVVDDSADNRDILRRHLEKQGYGVTTAADGGQCLELLRSGEFDLVLLDVLMPGMDGFEVLQRMKADAALRATPVVMISALDESNSVVRCIQMGAEDYLMKPFDPVLLSARIGASLDKKRLRDEERKSAEDLQQLLDQLRRTQDRLLVQENLASLGALTAGIAHEIRNPLNFINNFATASKELVAEMRELLPVVKPEESAAGSLSRLFGQLEQYVEKIDEHGKRADRIVRGMLMHSRGKSGEPESVDMKNLLSDAVNLAYHAMRAQDRRFNLRIETEFDPATGSIRAVPQEISRVFLNIINNAFYAAWETVKSKGDAFRPEVRVVARDLGESVEVRVMDNGPGIPPALLGKIFNPFFTTKPAGAGTGLGLSLSHDIVVRGHHGTIRAESEPGMGAEFIVTLPRGTEPNAQ
ncbi:MAG: response regulator [Acidobacteriota bacterium]|nr:response regulator [Acidobacteriota bacterium]